jgi:hypothetical protein
VIVVSCYKWGSGFSSDRVNLLFRAIRDKATIPLSYTCLTDDPTGLDDFIEARPIPDMGLKPDRWREGCWPKLSVFKPELFPGAEIVFYIDLDMMVLSDIAPFAERVRKTGDIHILREWNPFAYDILPLSMRPYRGVQAAFFAFRPEDLAYVYEDFVADLDAAFAKGRHDQHYLSNVLKRLHHWPSDWCVSFRRHCAWYRPLSWIFSPVRPRRAKIIVFHGKPRPWDLVQAPGVRWGTSRKFGFKPVGWVVDYFQKYDYGRPRTTTNAAEKDMRPE